MAGRGEVRQGRDARGDGEEDLQHLAVSRYIHVADAETYRPIAEILEELEALDAEAAESEAIMQSLQG